MLRDYQETTVNEVREAYIQKYKTPLVVLPTGAGKTVVFCHIAQTSVKRGKRVLILVHRVELLRQTSAKLNENGVNHGLINPKFTPNLNASVQVASVQTLVNRLSKINAPDLIIIDEAHHSTAGSWNKIINFFPNAKILGVTATPCRSDGTGLGNIFDKLIVGPQIAELIQRGFLVKPIVYAPASRVDLKSIKITRGDYDKDQIAQLIDKPRITGDAVSHYMRIADGMPAVVFCISVMHSQHVAEEFRARGYKAFSVDGTMDDAIREKLLSGLGNGSVDVITSCDLISEGTDIPAIGCAILLRPTMSTGLYLQQCLDYETEILTPDGFKFCDEVSDDEIVAGFNVDSGSIEWVKSLSKVKRALSDGEKMFGISSPHLNIRVTGGHDMIVKSRTVTSKNWIKQTAEHVSERKSMFTIPVSGIQKTKGANLSNDEIRFLGWFLTDGTLNKKTNCISISQSSSKIKHCELIRSCIEGAGLKYGEYHIKRTGNFSHCSDGIMFNISYGKPRCSDKHLKGWSHLSEWIDKNISDIYETLNEKQVDILIEAMNYGDGANDRKTITWTQKTMSIACGVNERMASRLQSLLIRRGYKCNLSVSHYDGKSKWHYLNVKKSSFSTIAGVGVKSVPILGKKYKRSYFKELEVIPGETVWCVENKLGSLITRRNGKIAIIGNCGRALRLSEGKTKAIILDHVGNTLIHGMPDMIREWSLEGSKKTKKSISETGIRVLQCSSCFAMFEPNVGNTCDVCGESMKIAAREIEQIEGELVKLSDEEIVIQKKEKQEQVRKARTLEELLKIQKENGYKYGWAQHMFNARNKKMLQIETPAKITIEFDGNEELINMNEELIDLNEEIL